ncbi:MAG: hypothetical protein CO108_09330 [Deltaproteobacteria bacterium CG_4_9_14_3_um_filter_63_12]|nr:MAG: hypothetical protein CO108_09330 [Deltaproteobacteria bacterium CG_4_9_14_3_um_filter_63_12]
MELVFGGHARGEVGNDEAKMFRPVGQPKWTLFLVALSLTLALGCDDGPSTQTPTDDATELGPDGTSNQGRVSDGLLAFYTFSESQSRIAYDRANTGDPIDLYQRETEYLERLQHRNGFAIRESEWRDNGFESLELPHRINDAIKESHEFTLELWCKPDDVLVEGPARMLTLSFDGNNRNVTLGQFQGDLAVGLRTDDPGVTANGMPTLYAPKAVTAKQETHYALTFADGVLKLYRNGVAQSLYDRTEDADGNTVETLVEGRLGTFSNWGSDFALTIGDETSGDRSWAGEIYLVAIYGRALSLAELQRNIAAGSLFAKEPPPVKDVTPPSSPLLTAKVLPNGVQLDWTRAADIGGVSGYWVYRSGSRIATTEDLSYFDTGLGNGAQYTYAIGAFDRDMNRTLSNSVTLRSAVVSEWNHLHVHYSQRQLEKDNGEQFFYLSDNATALLEKLSLTEMDQYLNDRALKGFTVIQFGLLPTLDGSTPDGIKPFGTDGLSLNEAYFERVDAAMAKMKARGLFPAIQVVPYQEYLDGATPVMTRDLATTLGEFVGARYSDDAVFILGAGTSPEGFIDVWHNLGMGLRTGGTGIRTFFPGPGESSSTWFHAEEWLGFNSVNSGQVADAESWALIEPDMLLETPSHRPCMELGGGLEDIPAAGSMDNPRLGDWEVRKAAYRSVFSGGHGYAYGSNEVSQFWTSADSSATGARTPWQVALDAPGARQMGYLRALFEGRPFRGRTAQPELVVGQPSAPAQHVSVTMEDDHWLFAYFPEGGEATLDVSLLSSPEVDGYWYSPRTGAYWELQRHSGENTRTYTPPTSGPGNDWVLVLDAPEYRYPPPGQSW